MTSIYDLPIVVAWRYTNVNRDIHILYEFIYVALGTEKRTAKKKKKKYKKKKKKKKKKKMGMGTKEIVQDHIIDIYGKKKKKID